MRVTCPSCNAEMSLDVLLGREEDARRVGAFIERNLALGGLLVRYLGLFRPGVRRLGLARMVGLLEELLPDIERASINRKGRDWAAPREAWQLALETVLAKRDKADLRLPLTGHGLLYEVMCGLAEKAEAQAERERELGRQSRRNSPLINAGPAAAAKALAVPGVAATQPAPKPDYSKPSRSALATKAAMQAFQDRKIVSEAPDASSAGSLQERPA